MCVLTARQTDLRLCRRSRASWVLARYWGSSACSSRMENGTMEPGQKGGIEGKKKKKQGGMRTGEIGRKGGRQKDRKQDENINLIYPHRLHTALKAGTYRWH